MRVAPKTGPRSREIAGRRPGSGSCARRWRGTGSAWKSRSSIGPREVLEPHRARRTASVPPPLVSGTSCKQTESPWSRRAPAHAAESHAEPGKGHAPVPDLRRSPRAGVLPGALDLHVRRERAAAPDPPPGVIASSMPRSTLSAWARTESGPSTRRAPRRDREIQRQVGLDLEHVLARAPEVQVGVEPAVGVVEHALDEGRLEIAEPAPSSAAGSAERRRRRRCRPPGASSPTHRRRPAVSRCSRP